MLLQVDSPSVLSLIVFFCSTDTHCILECLETILIVSRYRRLFTGHTLVGLAADCKDRKFYFSDINTGTISRASLDNTSDSQVIIDGKIQHAFKVDVQFVVCG